MPSVVTIGSSKDNTLYQNADNLSDGAGPTMFAGRTNTTGGTSIRRAVVAFNVAASVPAGATINSVTLTLSVDKTISGAETVDLHPLLADWGEGTSGQGSSPGSGGQGFAATTNDATWVHRFFNTTMMWANPGGDFSGTVSASASVGAAGASTWGSTPQMVADVQGWLNNPAGNFGWLLIGNEATAATTKSFGTKENPTPSLRPALTINFTASTPPPPPSGEFPLPSSVFVAAADAGGGPDVKVFNADGSFRAGFFAFDANFTGGVRVAVGDVNGDGFPDVITAAGPGGGPNIIVFSGKDRSEIANFFAFDIHFTGGVFIAAGDVNGDGFADIIVGADAGGGPNVTVFAGGPNVSPSSQPQPILSYFPYDIHFTGGVRVAAGDVNGDGKSEIITGAGPGGGPNVTVYQLVNGQAQVLQSYFAFDLHLGAGLFVGSGDVNGDGNADVIAGTGPLSAADTQFVGLPSVAVFSGTDASPLARFAAFPLDASFRGAVRVAATDFNGDGKAEVVTVHGPGGTPDVDILDGLSGNLVDRFFAFDPNFTGGVFLANTPK